MSTVDVSSRSRSSTLTSSAKKPYTGRASMLLATGSADSFIWEGCQGYNHGRWGQGEEYPSQGCLSHVYGASLEPPLPPRITQSLVVVPFSPFCLAYPHSPRSCPAVMPVCPTSILLQKASHLLPFLPVLNYHAVHLCSSAHSQLMQPALVFLLSSLPTISTHTTVESAQSP